MRSFSLFTIAMLVGVASAGFPVTQCPTGWRQAAKQTVWSSSSISVGTFPNYAVTYLAGTTDGSAMQVDCAANFVQFAGDGYFQWGPVTNAYSTFTCNVHCRNTVSSCPFILCEIYKTGTETNQTAQAKVEVA
mmetsp:Transcript_39286/g.54873  ORF Transcript_39286/g.54873 Transcript_39286/m.54873 type:complete len:133 (-) Transcript_39286:7-405(-)